MVARSAYAQLGHSPVLLAGTLLGMTVVYAAPPLLALSYPLHGSAGAAILAGIAWLLMGIAIWPTLRLYRQPVLLAPLLPLAALLYCIITVASALAHYRGRGGAWKGRVQSGPSRSQAPL
jgi:hypothetical protein